MNLNPKSVAAILLREHDNVEQAIAYAGRMAQYCADNQSTMSVQYQDASQELKAWKMATYTNRTIDAFLASHHKKGGDHFTADMLRAWAADAGFPMDEGNTPTIEE
jgi:hypothetical protein